MYWNLQAIALAGAERDAASTEIVDVSCPAGGRQAVVEDSTDHGKVEGNRVARHAQRAAVPTPIEDSAYRILREGRPEQHAPICWNSPNAQLL